MCDCKKDESDLRKIARLGQILDAARDEAWAKKPNDDDYRSWCYQLAWKPFWKIARSIKMTVDYCDPDSGYEEDMRAFYNAYSDASWLAKALEDDTATEEDDSE